LRAEAARLVLKLRAGARRAARPSALGGRINELKGLNKAKRLKAKGGGGGHASRCSGRARVVLCIKSKFAIGWPP
jgi:hypothetical protein